MNKSILIIKNINWKKIFFLFLTIILVFIGFLTVKLFLYYNESVKPLDEAKLYYEFQPNTIAYEYSPYISDINEQFQSYEISYGIDVSEWQGQIDWEKVKNTGISFAIIRCGFRQIDGSEIHEDAAFKKNIEGALAAGLRVGVYFFGTAKNEKEALEEAEFTINLIKDYELSYPVVYDVETFNRGRLKNISYSTITDNILTFTETVGSYGYETMVYSYHNALTYMLDTGKLDGKLIWLAHYADKTNYKGNHHMWQYTCEGKVDGINGYVDLNVSYFTYVDNERDVIQNPRYIKNPEISFKSIKDKIKTNKKAQIRTSPTDEIPNRLGYLNKNEILERTGISEKYSRIIYNGRTAYINNDDIIVDSSMP